MSWNPLGNPKGALTPVRGRGIVPPTMTTLLPSATVVVACDTTGLPSKTYRPSLLAVGAVVVLPDGNLGGPQNGQWHSYVRAPLEVLTDGKAQQAQRIHGIPVDTSLAAPTVAEAAAAWHAWLQRVAGAVAATGGDVAAGGVCWTAWNRAFAAQMVSGPFTPMLSGIRAGEDPMEFTARVMGSLGLIRPNREGVFRTVKLDVAVDWCLGGGAVFSHRADAPRALDRAILAANVLACTARQAPHTETTYRILVADGDADGPSPWDEA